MEFSVKAKEIEQSVTLMITSKAKELKEKGIDVVSFAAGEPDFNTPKNIINIIFFILFMYLYSNLLIIFYCFYNDIIIPIR